MIFPFASVSIARNDIFDLTSEQFGRITCHDFVMAFLLAPLRFTFSLCPERIQAKIPFKATNYSLGFIF